MAVTWLGANVGSSGGGSTPPPEPTNWKESVDTFADLASVEGLSDYDIRFVEDEGIAYYYDPIGTEWLPVSSGGGGGPGETTYWKQSVDTFADLAGVASPADFEVRLVEDEGVAYYYDPVGTAWLPVAPNPTEAGSFRGAVANEAALVGVANPVTGDVVIVLSNYKVFVYTGSGWDTADV